MIQPIYLWYSQRVGDVVYEVEVLPGPSIVGTSTVEFFETEFIAGKLYMMTMQSRDTQGAILDNQADNYEIEFTRSDGGSAGHFSFTAVHQASGLYKA